MLPFNNQQRHNSAVLFLSFSIPFQVLLFHFLPTSVRSDAIQTPNLYPENEANFKIVNEFLNQPKRREDANPSPNAAAITLTIFTMVLIALLFIGLIIGSILLIVRRWRRRKAVATEIDDERGQTVSSGDDRDSAKTDDPPPSPESDEEEDSARTIEPMVPATGDDEDEDSARTIEVPMIEAADDAQEAPAARTLQNDRSTTKTAIPSCV